MQEYKIILTWEAIYDVTDIADYIEEEFGQQRADRFQSDLKEQMQNLSQFSTAFPRTQILYRGYSIHKRSFPPSIIFYIIMEETKELITTDDIRSKVYIIRGQQVMLDQDLAEIYGYQVKNLNQQVKRNLTRFYVSTN